VVLGDFNDSKASASTKSVIGRGRLKLIDTRPTERAPSESDAQNSVTELRSVAWTHYYAAEDSYNRIDYILLSPGMAHEWLKSETFVLSLPDWGIASDHRPIVAAFESEDK
jgi:endonuclease/exonuclease/phosphatase family metal-dependent hydrolase